MSILSDIEIKEAIKNKELVIEDFSETLLQPASYDLRVGKKALKSAIEEKESPLVDLEKEKVLRVGTGEFIEILTYERLELSNSVSGRIGIKSYFTRKGIIPFTGAKIDPGFRGNLVVSLFNTGPRIIVMKYGEPFCTIEFSRLGKPAEHPYSGNYQNQVDFPSENIEFIVGAKGITLYEVAELMKKLSTDVRWMKWLLGGIFLALIAALIARAI